MAGALPPARPGSELIRAHRVYQERRGNLPRSLEKRAMCLRSFARHLEPRTLLEATREDIETFLDQRRTNDGRAITPRTRRVWISHLSVFYGWALAEELIDSDPTVRIVPPKMRRSLPRPIDDADLARALAEAPPQTRAILALMAYGGLRCQEVAGLDREDILEAKGLVRVVKGKGAKERIVPLHPEALAALRCLPLPRSGILFTRPRGGRFDPEQLSMLVRSYLRSIGVEATGHQLRHWFASNVYAACKDLRVVQELLGHENPATTAVYVAFSPADAAAAVATLTVGDSGGIGS